MTARPPGTEHAISAISSMATRSLLAELAADYMRRGGPPVHIQSVGGVDAARRVAAGEAFDLVILAADAIDRLTDAGHLDADSRVDLVRSPVAIAVRAGAPRPDVSTEAALRDAVMSATSVGCSTGPSGSHLARLFERWALPESFRERIVMPPPGVPVARLIAAGEVALGFQQLSELMHADGVDVIGPLPPGCDFVTTFTAGLCAGSIRRAPARDLLAFLTGPDATDAIRRHGMTPA